MKYEIGKFYQVPCVRASRNPPFFAKRGQWIPVLLPEHEDKEIVGFKWRHYHLDFRFLSIGRPSPMEVHHGVVLVKQGINILGEQGGPPLHVGPVVYNDLKCLREMPDWYPAHAAKWIPKLEEKYADACLIDGKCPHKGIDLSGCPAVNGIVVCPGHGLLWNAETGKLVPRPQPECDRSQVILP